MERHVVHGRRRMLAVGSAMLAFACTTPAAAQSAGQWKNGQHVYAKVCANCHDSGVGPVIKGRGLDPGHFQHVVRHGQKAMPAFRHTEIDDGALRQVAEMLSKSLPPGLHE